MLKDTRFLMKEYGIGRCFEMDWKLYDFEIFMNFWAEYMYPMTYAFTAVMIVVLGREPSKMLIRCSFGFPNLSFATRLKL